MDIKPGDQFGHLVVIQRDESVQRGHFVYFCRCDACGKETRVRSSNLRSGKTRSCSCLRGGTRTGAGGAVLPIRAPEGKAPVYKLLKNGIKINGTYFPRATLMQIIRKWLEADKDTTK